jgi:hypothetical protein
MTTEQATASGPSDWCPAPRPSVATAVAGGQVVLFDDVGQTSFELNRSASLVWLLMDGVSTTLQIADGLSDLIDGPVAQLPTEVVSTVEQFRAMGLLSVPDVATEGAAKPLGSVPARLLPPPYT